jgi:hypothetical protein
MTKKLPIPVETRVVYVDVDPDDPEAVAEANAALNEMFNAHDFPPRPLGRPQGGQSEGRGEGRLAQLLEETRALLPPRLKNDRYWLPCTLIFHTVFPTHIPTYFNFDIPQIDVPRFNKKIRGYLSHGEGVLADLAFHLYNDSNRLPRNGLTNLRVLDKFHFELAMLAIRLSHDLSTSPSEYLKGAPMP